ncbi:hypothetical protein BGZ99_003480 [Dissophora globulifera]|uniref:Uncharacterized protein n=1 Tax=Dissophora globulifera TaxID=979702 RepID=A0A9P6RY49_9FUNG|nr:hypothetical protein BGZ99_003480 [Dissophora globulifera]
MGILMTSLGSTISIHQLYGQCTAVGIQVKASISVLIYRKVLVLSSTQGGTGEIINMVATDITRIIDAVTNFHFLWSAMVETILILTLAFLAVGWASGLTAVFLVAIGLPVQFYLGHLTSDAQAKQTVITTERVHLMSQILTAIKLVKFYAWEGPFRDQVNILRLRESQLFKKSFQVRAINMAVVFTLPVVIILIALTIYDIRRVGQLSSSVVFTAVGIFNTLRYPFLMLPVAVKSTSGARLALHRLNDFLAQPEIENLKQHSVSEGGDIALELVDGEFTWDDENGSPVLARINLQVKRGQVVAIVGDVGSGKSSLLAALLGQIRQTGVGPRLKLFGKVSFAPQEAWLINASLRENIVFGKQYETERYNAVLKACALEQDLALLSYGDMTEIGERGGNLSGGQKQRVSLARAVYDKSDIVIMDDTLSAVDQNVGKHIFDQCIRGYLSGRTVIIATHQLQHLQQCDKIVMLQAGSILCQGTFEELMSGQSTFQSLVETHVSRLLDYEVPQDTLIKEDNGTRIGLEYKLDSEKHFETARTDQQCSRPTLGPRRRSLPPNTWLGETPGTTTLAGRSHNRSIYGRQISEVSGGTLISRARIQFINDARGGCPSAANGFDSSIHKNKLTTDAISEGIAQGHNVGCKENKASGTGHLNFAYMNNTRPVGAARTVNIEDFQRLPENRGPSGDHALIGKDKSTEDTGWPDYVKYFKAGSGVVITVLLVIFFFFDHGIRVGSDYWLRLWVPNSLHTSDAVYLGVYSAFITAFFMVLLARGFWFASEVSLKSKELHDRAFQARESVMRAPMAFFETTSMGRILSVFSKSMFVIDDTFPDAVMQLLQYFPLALGAFLIVAYVVHWQNAVAMVVLLLIAIAFVWYGYPADTNLKLLEVQIWGAFYLDVLASLMVYSTALFLVIYRKIIFEAASVAGLALANALLMLVFLQWTVRQIGEVHAQSSTVGQLDFYGRKIEPEAPAENPATCPDESWPDRGHIIFDQLVLRYRDDSPDVLKKVSFTIQPKEKVGIVGRTGSGKSSLLVALLRIVEASEGAIIIDGIDISTLGLQDLRSKVGVIPQESVLFVGTIRSNLDPFNQHEDRAVWRALHAVHMGDKVMEMPLKLDTPVVEHGKNFSLGQRQLICIARSLVIGSRIIVLDEATASIDMATDKQLQETIRANFADCTVLTIAHRLNTIIESDKVLVMDGGVVAEFGEPYALLQNPDGAFTELVRHAGEAVSRKLAIIAEDAHWSRSREEATELSLSAPNDKTALVESN